MEKKKSVNKSVPEKKGKKNDLRGGLYEFLLRHKGIILPIVAIAAIVGFFVINTVKLRNQSIEKEAELASLRKSYEEQSVENSELAEKVSGEDESEYMERYAREKMDYIMPDERVYADSQYKN